mgnify:CR=1 FL=1
MKTQGFCRFVKYAGQYRYAATHGAIASAVVAWEGGCSDFDMRTNAWETRSTSDVHGGRDLSYRRAMTH